MRGFVRLGAMPTTVASPQQTVQPSTPAETTPVPAAPADEDDVILDEEGQPTRSEEGAMLRGE